MTDACLPCTVHSRVSHLKCPGAVEPVCSSGVRGPVRTSEDQSEPSPHSVRPERSGYVLNARIALLVTRISVALSFVCQKSGSFQSIRKTPFSVTWAQIVLIFYSPGTTGNTYSHHSLNITSNLSPPTTHWLTVTADGLKAPTSQ